MGIDFVVLQLPQTTSSVFLQMVFTFLILAICFVVLNVAAISGANGASNASSRNNSKGNGSTGAATHKYNLRSKAKTQSQSNLDDSIFMKDPRKRYLKKRRR